MGKREWFGAALAAFGIGCSEQPTVDAKSQDVKDAKIEQAPKDVLTRDDAIDEELDVSPSFQEGVPEGGGSLPVEREVQKEAGEEIESELREFRNVLMEEANAIKPGKWMGDKYDDEVKRLKNKLLPELSKDKFSNSFELLKKFFVPRKDEAKDSVLGLLSGVKEGKETKFLLNKEYRDNVKLFAEKYGAQYGVPVEVIYGVMAVENAGKHDPNKNNADGAYGIMQVQPGVVDHLQEMKFNGEDWNGVSVADLEGNIRAGTAYLNYLHERYNQWPPALMAYNAGPAAFERDIASFSDGSLAGRAKLRGDIRDLKKQIKEKKKEKEVDEEAISLLEEQLKAKQEEFGVQNERLDQLRAGVVKGDGWKAFFSDKNLWWACSRFGGTLYANSNARYPVEAMYLSKPMHEIMQSEGGEVELTPLVEEMK